MLGYPIILTEKFPVLGTANDVLLVNPIAYAVGARTEVTVEFDRGHKFDSDQIAARVRMRLDAQALITAA